MHILRNILGIFVFDSSMSVKEEHFFASIADFKNSDEEFEKAKLRNHAKEPDEKTLNRILAHFKTRDFLEKLRQRNTELTRHDIKASVNCDALVSQAINSYEELDRVANSASKRLRDWYELYNPEISSKIYDNFEFCKAVCESSKEDLLSSFRISKNESLGADLSEKDISQITSLAKSILQIYSEKKVLSDYAEKMMLDNYPNINAVAGPIVGAKLIEHAGSLKRLSEMPSSTVQILGAETALFRHLKTGARPPRHGLIINHPLIAKATERLHGKIARSLADKISIAAKVDYFRGEFIGDSLRAQLEKKVEGMK